MNSDFVKKIAKRDGGHWDCSQCRHSDAEDIQGKVENNFSGMVFRVFRISISQFAFFGRIYKSQD